MTRLEAAAAEWEQARHAAIDAAVEELLNDESGEAT